MGDRSGISTGRLLTRVGNFCHGCHARIETGEPRDDGNWTAALSLSKDQVDLLVLAAAEYTTLSAECFHCQHKPHRSGGDGHEFNVILDDQTRRQKHCGCTNYVPRSEPDAIPFVDWMAVSALPGLYSRETQRERRRDAA